jgi:hypothetical protein
MISYAEREIFTDREMALWCDACDLIKRVSLAWTNELRCHELARAAHAALGRLRYRGSPYKTTVVDGKLWAIEHSWLVVPAQGPRGLTRTAILDVYCPGRMPQVQLLDNHFVIARGYEPGEPRTDIKLDIVGRLEREMSK